MEYEGVVETDKDTYESENDVNENRCTSVKVFVNNDFLRTVYFVGYEVKVVVYDVAPCCYKNSS